MKLRRTFSLMGLRRCLRNRDGSTAIVLAVLAPILIGGLALGTEIGQWELTKRRLQNAADTAAFAAATQLRSGLGQSDLEAAALQVADNSGFNSARGSYALATPPTSGAYSGDSNAVKLQLVQNVNRTFSRFFDSRPVSISAAATALVQDGRPVCILALAPSQSGAVTVNNGSQIELTNCDVATNSISPSSIHLNSGADLEIDCMTTVGGVLDDGASLAMSACSEPIESAPVTSDPYEGITEPTAVMSQSCTSVAAWQQSNGSPQANKRYCGGATINNKLSNLAPGVYVFDGGDWRFTNNAEVQGANVSFVFTGGARLFIEKNAKFNLDAQDAGSEIGGAQAGVVLYFDPDDGQLQHDLLGEGAMSLTGLVYAPKADLHFASNTSSGTGSGGCTQIIAYTVTFESGSADFDSECVFSGKREIFAAQAIRLVE